MGLLDGRVAIVTGAAGGIGKGFAQALANEGAQVAIADIDGGNAKAVADELEAAGHRSVGVPFDQADPDAAVAMVAAVESALGPADILVNNASLFSTLDRTAALDVTPDGWNNVVHTNLNGVFFCCRAVMPGMVSRGYGKIVNIASASIFQAKNNLAHYVAAKSGVVGLTRALAREYGDSGITVNAISPGATDSGREGGIGTAEYLQSKVGARSIRRVQNVADLVGPMLFLVSASSDFVTGQNLVVDGGGVFQ